MNPTTMIICGVDTSIKNGQIRKVYDANLKQRPYIL